MENSLLYYRARCIGCGYCITKCPKNALSAGESGIVIDRSACIKCGTCGKICYPRALITCGREVTVDDILFEAEQDRSYYNNSGGGITLSGGEALGQLEFTGSLIEACNKKGLSIAVETNLNHPFELIGPVLKKFSHIYADIKIFNNEAHKKWTGTDNETILANARKLGTLHVPITFRTPLIPGATDNPAELNGISRFISDIPNVECWELLNFNPLGAGKYENLSMDNPFSTARPFAFDYIRTLYEKIDKYGIPVIFG
jgi:pyruvate formate lyase activating enzyme